MQRHSRSRSRSRQSSPDKRPQTPEDSRVSNCGGKKRKAVWLVDQTETGQTGFWREAKWCGPHLEKQYQDGEESSDVAVVSGPGQVQYYTHTMKKGEEMWQLRFRDPERSELIFNRGLVRATMQTSRDDQSQSDPDGAEAAAGCGKGYKGVVPPTPMEEINGPPPATPKGNGGTRWQVSGGAGGGGKGGGGGGGGGQGWQEPNAAALVAGETVVGSGGKEGGGMGEGGQDDGPPRGGGEAAGPASIAAEKRETAPTTPVYTSEG